MEQNAKQVDLILQEINELIANTENDITQPENLNLDFLANKIKEFVKLLNSLPPEAIASYTDKIRDIQNKFVEWQQSLTEIRNSYKEQLEKIDKNEKAASSYITTNNYKSE
jgi:hypothetical protein